MTTLFMNRNIHEHTSQADYIMTLLKNITVKFKMAAMFTLYVAINQTSQ